MLNVIAEVNIAVDECGSEINEYFLSTVNKPPSDVMSNIAWVEDSLEKSGKHVTEKEQLSDLATQFVAFLANKQKVNYFNEEK